MSKDSYHRLELRVGLPGLIESGILLESLTPAGIEALEEIPGGAYVYGPVPQLDHEDLNRRLEAFPEVEIVGREILPSIDWNREWEQNFQPIRIPTPSGDVEIRAPFHPAGPQVWKEILIQPKMAFGTGHHATTSLMVGLMAEMDLKGTHCLDFGCGTGILAILAAKLGALTIDAIDIDPWAYENTCEHLELNATPIIQCILGGFESIPPGRKYDVIAANLTRNLLGEHLHTLQAHLAPTGRLFLSGFYQEDAPFLLDAGAKLGLEAHRQHTQEDWMAIELKPQT